LELVFIILGSFLQIINVDGLKLISKIFQITMVMIMALQIHYQGLIILNTVTIHNAK